MSNLSITERKSDSIVVLDLKGDIRLGEGNIAFHNTLRQLVEKGERKILINLAEVSHVDSSGLGELIAGYATLKRNGGEMKLVHLTDRVRELIVITKLLTVFDVYDSEAEAVNSFKSLAAQPETMQAVPVTGELDKSSIATQSE